MTATVIPFNRFLEEREKKLDPKGYQRRKEWEVLDKQARANQAAKPLLVGTVPEMDAGFDDIPVMDRGSMALLWGIGDPGDENT